MEVSQPEDGTYRFRGGSFGKKFNTVTEGINSYRRVRPSVSYKGTSPRKPYCWPVTKNVAFSILDQNVCIDRSIVRKVLEFHLDPFGKTKAIKGNKKNRVGWSEP